MMHSRPPRPPAPLSEQQSDEPQAQKVQWQATPDVSNHDNPATSSTQQDRTYPFRNYWTANGDLSEVLLALPTKRDGDAMIGQYFLNVDPLYPVIQCSLFKQRYEEFWELPGDER